MREKVRRGLNKIASGGQVENPEGHRDAWRQLMAKSKERLSRLNVVRSKPKGRARRVM
jgi:hypothetical protein